LARPMFIARDHAAVQQTARAENVVHRGLALDGRTPFLVPLFRWKVGFFRSRGGLGSPFCPSGGFRFLERHVHPFQDNLRLLIRLFLHRFGFTLRQEGPQLPFSSVHLRYHMGRNSPKAGWGAVAVNTWALLGDSRAPPPSLRARVWRGSTGQTGLLPQESNPWGV